MEELEEVKELVLHYARGVWKNRWIAIVVAWVLLLGGVMVVDQIKYQYKAQTKVYIDSTSVLKPLLRGLAIQSDFQAIVQLMVRQLLSRPNLERAARAMDMDLNVNTAADMEGLINGIRKRVKVSAKKRSGIYTISYTDIKRERARQMVQTLLDIFVEDTLGKTVNESGNAIEFLDKQIEKYDGLLREAEVRLEEFKRKNIGLMPKDGNSYYNQLQATEGNLEKAQLILAELQNRRDKIKSQLDDLRANKVDKAIPLKSSLDGRIEEQENQLDDLLLLYTEEHPDVINARHVLDLLLEKKKKEEAQYVAPSRIEENPVFQELQIALGKAEADISSVETRVGAMKRKRGVLKKRIDVVPKIEAELARLNRNYQVHKKNYNALVGRREQARISEDVQSGTEQVKFRIIEPPFVPVKPDYPNKPLFDVGVLVVALGIGYGLSLLISLFQPVFYTQRDLRNVIGGSVLGAIRKFDTLEVTSNRRRNLALFGLANLLLLCTAGSLIFYHTQGVLILSRLQMMVM